MRRRVSHAAASELRRLLEAEQIQEQVRRYIDQHGWDVVVDEEHWRRYQRARMAEDYRDEVVEEEAQRDDLP